jgi:hypothetical protein
MMEFEIIETPRQRIRRIVEGICQKHDACYRDVVHSNCRIQHIVDARIEAYRALTEAGFTRDQIVSHFGHRPNVRYQLFYALRGRAIYQQAAE